MNSPYILGLRCVLCGGVYAMDAVEYVCPKHGDEGIVDVVYDYQWIGRRTGPAEIGRNPDRSIWRYLDLLPLDAESLESWREELAGGFEDPRADHGSPIADRLSQPATPAPLFAVGWTPLYHARQLGQRLGMHQLYLKDDGRMPSASFKDRASAVGIARAHELKRPVITAASTGNAAASLATLTAGLGFTTHIFVPESAPPAKIAQLLIHGANVFAVKGTYDQAFDLCLEASHAFGWYSRNTGYNPYLSEGKKTAAYEICEQLTLSLEPSVGDSAPVQWRAPDRIFVSVGDGCIIGGLGKGLRDLWALGWIDRLPKLIGVQAQGSAACYDAWQRLRSTDYPVDALTQRQDVPILAKPPHGTPLRQVIHPVDPHTLADSISAGLPRDGVKALAAVVDTGGDYVTVTDQEILDAMNVLGKGAGVFAEPAASAAFAGLLSYQRAGLLAPDETVVVLLTGSGLKDIASAVKAAGQPHSIEVTLDAVKQVLATHEQR